MSWKKMKDTWAKLAMCLLYFNLTSIYLVSPLTICIIKFASALTISFIVACAVPHSKRVSVALEQARDNLRTVVFSKSWMRNTRHNVRHYII
jgi:hypothetical protein